MISVCVPHWNRASELARMYREYLTLYPGLELEFSVCDDGSSPRPPAPHRGTLTCLPVKDHALNPCVPLNVAVMHARGEILVLTGPEVEHRVPILPIMAAALEAGGEFDYLMASCQDVDGRWLCGSRVRGGEDGRGPMPAGSGFHFCAMLRRELFERAGGFDEEYRAGQAFEDNDWLYRLEHAGARFVMRDDLIVWHRRMPCAWPAGGHERNRRLFESKWGLACSTTA